MGQRTARRDHRPVRQPVRRAASGSAGDSRGYLASRLTLTRYAGHAVSPQFTMNTDNDSTEQGWYLDDIRVYTCGRAPVPRSDPADLRRGDRGHPAHGDRRSLVAVRRDVAGPVVRRRSADRRRHRHVVRRRAPPTSGSGSRCEVTATAHGTARVDVLAGDGTGGQRVGEPRRRRRRLVEQPPWPTAGESPPETLPGLRETVRAARPKRAAEDRGRSRAVDPVAHVLVDTPLAHLDRPFDYAVPASMAESAVPGARVKVRFAGKDLDGFVVARSRPHRPHRHAHAAAAGRQPRARAPTGGRRARRAARRALRRHPCRRAPARRPAPARDHGEAALRARGAGRRRPRRRRSAPGAPTRRPRRSSPTWPAVARPGPSGRPCRGRTGRGCSPRRRRPRSPADAAACSCVPDHRDVARLDAALTARPRARAPRGADRRRGAGPALPRVPGRLARHPSGRGRHPGRGVRAGPRPRAGGDLGRRRRPARRAPRAVPPRP